MESPSSSSASPSGIDWEQARGFLRRQLALIARGVSAEQIDDLVQEACVRFVRASRREPIDNQEAFLTVLARRTWADAVRRRVRWEQYFQTTDPEHLEATVAASAGPELGDLRDRIALVAQEILDRHGSGDCGRLLHAFLKDLQWASVASDLGIGYAAVRKRWSRCLRIVREVLAQDPRYSSFAK